MVPRLLGTLPHRTGMSLATLLPRRMGRQVPWPMSRLGTMVPRRPMSHDARRPGSLGTSTIELFQECWDRGLTGPLVPSCAGNMDPRLPMVTWDPSDRSGHGRRRLHEHLGTKVPGHPAIDIPAVAIAPEQASCRPQLGTLMSSATLVPCLHGDLGKPGPKVFATPIFRMPHGRRGRSISQAPVRAGNPVVDGRSTGLVPRGSRRQGAMMTRVPSPSMDGQVQGPTVPPVLGSRINLISRRLHHQDDRVRLLCRSRGGRWSWDLGTGLPGPDAPGCPLGSWVARPSIRLGPQASTRPGSLEPRVHSTNGRHRDQGIKASMKLGHGCPCQRENKPPRGTKSHDPLRPRCRRRLQGHGRWKPRDQIQRAGRAAYSTLVPTPPGRLYLEVHSTYCPAIPHDPWLLLIP